MKVQRVTRYLFLGREYNSLEAVEDALVHLIDKHVGAALAHSSDFKYRDRVALGNYLWEHRQELAELLGCKFPEECDEE